MEAKTECSLLFCVESFFFFLSRVSGIGFGVLGFYGFGFRVED